MVKKYLISSFAVLAAITLTTSCSKDDVFDASKDINVAKYEALFIQKFGQPSADQTWGFGSYSTKAIVPTESITRSIGPSGTNFPDDADASKFLEDVPGDVNTYADECRANNQTNGYATGTSYIDPSWTDQVNIWGSWDGTKNSGGKLYVKGNCDFSNRKFYLADNSELYLVKGATLTLSGNDAGNLQGGTKIYIAEGAKIIANGQFKLNKGMFVYNHGTIEAPSLTLNENVWGSSEYNTLYNGAPGKIIVTSRLAPEKEYAVIVNDGEIECAEFNTAGSAHLQNNGTMTVTGKTIINSNNNTWENNGQYTTQYFNYTAGSNKVYNNCRLTVQEDFNINLGDNDGTNGFVMNAGAGVVTKNFKGGNNPVNPVINGGPFKITMGAGSVFKVTDTAYMNATKDNYGFYAVGDDFAVLDATHVVKNLTGESNVVYSGKMAVVAEDHFQQGNSGQYLFINYKNGASADYIYAPGFNEGTCDIKITETECNPGFGGGSLPTLRVMAEDLTVTDATKDFDFNDIVFTVLEWTSDGVKIRLDAAGGTLPLIIGNKELTIGSNGNPVGTKGVNYYEVHEAFAEANPGKGINTDFSKGKLTMINTANGKHYAYSCPELFLSGDFTAPEHIDKAINIKIFVNKGTVDEPNWLELDAQEGKVAKKFGCDPKLDWCDERQDIETRYDKFSKWVQGQETFFY